MVYLKVAEAVLFARISRYLWPQSRPQTAQTSLGTRLSWPRIHRARTRVQCTSGTGHTHFSGIIRSGSAGKCSMNVSSYTCNSKGTTLTSIMLAIADKM